MHLELRPSKRGQGGFDFRLCGGHRLAIDADTLGIVGGGGLAQLDDRPIAFVHAAEEAGQPGCRADHDHQDAGGQGIERAGVPDTARMDEVPHRVHHIVGGHA